jgi:hypothetical protein
MLHVEGVTPEAAMGAVPDADRATISRSDMASAWSSLNEGPETIDLVAIGSPHASLNECRALAEALGGGKVREGRQGRPGRSSQGRSADATGGERRQGPSRSVLVLDFGARLPDPSADADDQLGQVRSLRTGSLRPVRAVWQPCRLCRGGGSRQGREEASGLDFVMMLATRQVVAVLVGDPTAQDGVDMEATSPLQATAWHLSPPRG